MQFLKAEGFLKEGENEWLKVEDTRRAQMAFHRKISSTTSEFNAKIAGEACVFPVEIHEDSVTMGLLCQDIIPPEALVGHFLELLGLNWDRFFMEEVTFETFTDMLGAADREDFIRSGDEILEHFSLEPLAGGFRRGIEFGENLIEYAEKDAIYEQVKKYLADDTFIPELDRIYAGRSKSKATGHPVHYMVETDDHDMRREMYRRLLEALHANERLNNRRYVFVDYRPGNNVSRLAYDCLYKSCIGGTVVVRYNPGDDSEDDHASSGREIIEMLCETMMKYRKDVLTVFCLPRECTKTKDLFFENLGSTAFVELKENFVQGERAQAFLKDLAKGSGLRSDKKLLALVEANTGYLAADLKKDFDEWYYEKLKTSVYPQYKSQISAKKEVKKAAPKGTAYEELMEMIGLGEAKGVINEALNFYKAQKLFADQGLPVTKPSMHMVFTGNPGTAKTSVARLFAEIMKDNGLLSKGKLIEVGRGDLVGKYVGWTAQTVQKKFKEAQGSVLFIDEAYSLCDDRDGSFGDEAINTIVQEMENHRDDVVVIFAGYPDKMAKFLDKNPGLRSRIAFHVPFADYSAEELLDISRLIAKKSGLSFTEGAGKKMVTIFETACSSSDFGNGRFARNLIEKARLKQAGRLLAKDLSEVKKDDLLTLCEEDFETPVEYRKPEEKKHFGFCA